LRGKLSTISANRKLHQYATNVHFEYVSILWQTISHQRVSVGPE